MQYKKLNLSALPKALKNIFWVSPQVYVSYDELKTMKPKIYIQNLSRFEENFLLAELKQKPGFVFLDSNDQISSSNRFSFICFEPFLALLINPDLTITVQEKNKTFLLENSGPIQVLTDYLAKYQIKKKLKFTPFYGGAIGYLSYEASIFFQKPCHKPDVKMPLGYFAFYNKTIVIDHKNQKKYFIFIDYDHKIKESDTWQLTFKTEAKKTAPACQAVAEGTAQHQKQTARSNFTKAEYLEAILKAKRYIFEGDIYQVNLSHQISCEYQKDAFELYQKLRQVSPAPFSAYLSFEHNEQKVTILSSSPERFIAKKGRTLITEPIKGTIKRGFNDKDDKKQKQELLNSLKNRAELLMIIDLERNDLGRIAEPGSVKVKKLISLQKFRYLFHLVSTITAKIRKSITLHQIFVAMFPGGSITGAPKLRAMEIIKELETVNRNIYTGALGWIGLNQDFDFNIAIRTIYLINEKLYFHVGGGIVADSDPEAEWEETMVKAAGILAALDLEFPHE